MKKLYAEITLAKNKEGWKFVSCGSDFLEMTGFSRSEIKNRFSDEFLRFVPGDEANAFRKFLAGVSESVNVAPKLFTFLTGFEEPIHVLVQAERLAGSDEELHIGISNISPCLAMSDQKEQHPEFIERNPVSRDWLLEESNDVIYVSDFYNYDLLYMNNRAKRMFGVEGEYHGRKCYEVLQGLDRPCEFCTNHLLSRDSFYTWEIRNNIIGHYFMLHDRIVDWYGLPARIEFATDVTVMDSRNQALEKQVQVDQTIIECLRKLNGEKTLDDAARLLLAEIGDFYQADRTFIIQFDEKNEMVLKYEWHRPEAGRAILSDREWKHYVDTTSSCFKTKQSRQVNEIEILRGADPELWEIFKKNKISCQRVVPLLISGKPAGFIGLDNPSLFRDELTVLETLGYFISEEISRRQMADRLLFLSYHDALTGLENRNRFVEYMQQMAGADLKSLGVAMANLNALGEINQYRGHAAGDEVVIHTAKILRSCFPDGHIFRLSGDEFLIFDENRQKQAFIDGVKQIYEESPKLEAYGISVGYAWSAREISVDRLMKQANDMMLVRKRNYYESIRSQKGLNSQRYSHLDVLLKSIRGGAFEVYLQPKVGCIDEIIKGAEALARYMPNKGEKMYPAHFIPELERNYTIKYLDLYIFEQVCKTLARWKQENRRLIPIAVNCSRLTLIEPGLVHELKTIASSYQIAPELLVLEITESLGDYEDNTIREISDEIKAEGFGLSLDDFGSSYSNMSILSVVPADELKLDRSLIVDMQNSKSKLRIIKHLLMLCNELGIQSVAEGVENRDQLDLLKKLKCDGIQGFLFGKPAAVADFERNYLVE